MSAPVVRIAQSADPDDAFMAWALEKLCESDGLEVVVEFGDIETLNQRAIEASVDLTALSVGAYPQVADRYRILRCGASFGDAYGPLVVGREAVSPGPDALAGLRVAIPGHHTTAAMLLRVFVGPVYEEVVLPFDAILDAVLCEQVDAGLIIHEGQLIYPQLGLHPLFEPATEWARRESLPLPLGVVAVRRELPAHMQQRLAGLFLESLRRAFDNPEAALDFAATYARGLERPILEQYVYRYVNASTLDMGSAGERAIGRLFALAVETGVLTHEPVLDLL